jgi:hypothetical protein
VKRQRGKKLKIKGSQTEGRIRKAKGQEEERKKVKRQRDKKSKKRGSQAEGRMRKGKGQVKMQRET